MPSGAEAPRPLRRVLGSPNNCGGVLTQSVISPQRPGDTLGVQSRGTGGVGRGREGDDPRQSRQGRDWECPTPAPSVSRPLPGGGAWPGGGGASGAWPRVGGVCAGRGRGAARRGRRWRRRARGECGAGPGAPAGPAGPAGPGLLRELDRGVLRGELPVLSVLWDRAPRCRFGGGPGAGGAAAALELRAVLWGCFGGASGRSCECRGPRAQWGS